MSRRSILAEAVVIGALVTLAAWLSPARAPAGDATLAEPRRSAAPTARAPAVAVPTPWGEFDVSLIRNPHNLLFRLPLTPRAESSRPEAIGPRLLPYVAAGSPGALEVEELPDLTLRSEPDGARVTAVRAGAGVVWHLDPNLELFGEYQFVRLRPELSLRSEGLGGSLNPGLDTRSFSLGLSIRY